MVIGGGEIDGFQKMFSGVKLVKKSDVWYNHGSHIFGCEFF